MKNIEKIKEMNTEELANFMESYASGELAVMPDEVCRLCKATSCKLCLVDYLDKEIKNE